MPRRIVVATIMTCCASVGALAGFETPVTPHEDTANEEDIRKVNAR